MFYSLVGLALALCVAEIAATIKNYDIRHKLNPTKNWVFCYKFRWLLGAVLSMVSLLGHYTLEGSGQTYTIIGFPLMVAGFDSSGRDYVSAFTPFLAVGNAALWFYSTELFLYLWSVLTRYRDV